MKKPLNKLANYFCPPKKLCCDIRTTYPSQVSEYFQNKYNNTRSLLLPPDKYIKFFSLFFPFLLSFVSNFFHTKVFPRPGAILPC